MNAYKATCLPGDNLKPLLLATTDAVTG